MHVGKEGKISKSEAIHIPAKVTDKPVSKGTLLIMNNNTHLQFTDKIKYLGSTITTNLRDEIDVAMRIAIAHSQITQMRELFNCREISIATK
jgi:fructose-1,6-bisphosphatase/sedoheptulose 1,7-bisphosphatase-like protein